MEFLRPFQNESLIIAANIAEKVHHFCYIHQQGNGTDRKDFRVGGSRVGYMTNAGIPLENIYHFVLE